MILTALMVPLLAGFLGLSLDVGRYYHIKRRMQTAADAGALGGAHEIWRRNFDLVTSAAKGDAKLNGYDDDLSYVTVAVNRPPSSGAWVGNSNFVEVIIDQPVASVFFRFFNPSDMTVRARAVAGLVAWADYCVLALDPLQRGSLKVNGGAILASTCGVMVNSIDSKAIIVDGGACIYGAPAGVGVSGGFVENGSANCVDPDPVADIPPAMDPLAYLAAPSIGSLTPLVTGFKLTAPNPSGLPAGVVASVNLLTQTITINPGLYVDGIKISGSGYTVKFNPGTYIVDGGGIDISGGLTVSGEGVTFFNTNSTPLVANRWGDIYIGGDVSAQFSAPTSGPYTGMLFWTDPAAPDKEPGNIIAGNSGSKFAGTLYFPSTHLTFTGTSDSGGWSMIVADTITVSGNSTLANDYTKSPIPLPTRKVTLVE